MVVTLKRRLNVARCCIERCVDDMDSNSKGKIQD
jgi:hypothetical protein